MKFSCEKALLSAAVSVTSRAVAVKSSIPAMEGILIEAGETLRLTGYNLETGIQASVPAEITQTGSLVLSARLFGEFVRKMPDDMVIFTAQNYTVNIKCGLSEFNILGTDSEEFPELPAVDQQNALTIGQPVLRSMISQTLFAVSDNESRPIHTGSLFEVDAAGLTIVSVDGYRLALRHEAVDEKKGADAFSLVVRGGALGEVEKICAGEGTVTVTQGARHIMFQTGDTVLVCRRLEGDFLAYRNAIPRNNSIKVEVETTNLEEVREALEARADIIMLDNMNTSEMAAAVQLIGGAAQTEASGNMSIPRLKEVAATGVDFISVGALTHSVTALDISMNIRQ